MTTPHTPERTPRTNFVHARILDRIRIAEDITPEQNYSAALQEYNAWAVELETELTALQARNDALEKQSAMDTQLFKEMQEAGDKLTSAARRRAKT